MRTKRDIERRAAHLRRLASDADLAEEPVVVEEPVEDGAEEEAVEESPEEELSIEELDAELDKLEEEGAPAPDPEEEPVVPVAVDGEEEPEAEPVPSDEHLARRALRRRRGRRPPFKPTSLDNQTVLYRDYDSPPSETGLAVGATEETEESDVKILAEVDYTQRRAADDTPVETPVEPEVRDAADDTPVAPVEETPDQIVAEPVAEEPVVEPEPEQPEVRAITLTLAEVFELQDDDDTRTDVHMTLHNAALNDPFWNVTVGGIPVARISLEGQDEPEKLRAAFVSPKYAEEMKRWIQHGGLKDTLEQVHASYYATSLDQSDLAKRVRAQVEESLRAEYAQKLADYPEKFVEFLSIAASAVDRGMVEGMDNPITTALDMRLSEFGIEPADRVSIIRETFTKHMPALHANIVATTVRFMKLDPAALEQVVGFVKTATVVVPSDDAPDTSHYKGLNMSPEASGADLRARLAKSSVPVTTSYSPTTRTGAGPSTLGSKEDVRRGLRLGSQAK